MFPPPEIGGPGPTVPLIRAEGLAVGYRGKALISDIDIELRAGEALILLGPNGAGKSTLIKTLIGALPAVNGSVELDGQPLSGWEARRLAQVLAYVPQQEVAYYPFSVRECVLMGRLPYASGMFESKEDFDAAERAMVLANCISLADRAVTELSGGEQQRVLLARALAQEPQLLVLDEPSSHLDIAHAYELLETLRQLAESGTAIIAAVHDLNWAARFKSHCLLLGEGQVLASGETRQILKSPQISRCYGRQIEAIEVGNGALALIPK